MKTVPGGSGPEIKKSFNVQKYVVSPICGPSLVKIHAKVWKLHNLKGYPNKIVIYICNMAHIDSVRPYINPQLTPDTTFSNLLFMK